MAARADGVLVGRVALGGGAGGQGEQRDDREAGEACVHAVEMP